MTPLELAGAVGFLAPLLVAFLNQEHWSTQTKQIVMVVTAVVLGVLTAAVQGKLDLHNLAVTLPVVVAACQVAYTVLWKPTGIAPAVEKATAAKPVLTLVVATPETDVSSVPDPLSVSTEPLAAFPDPLAAIDPATYGLHADPTPTVFPVPDGVRVG